jgi:serine/threonine protein kinase
MAEQETPAPGQAPPTRLDSEPPPTSLDGGAPPTSLDQQAPPTSLDAGAPPTVLDSTTAGDADTYVRLPQPLRADYEALRDMASGGEGDLLLTRYRPSEELRVVKIYRGDRRRDAEALSLLKEADPAHVVVIYDSGQHGGRWWEAMEYCEHGSLVELIASEGPKLPAQRLREVIEEVTGALEHLHSLRIPHRDLKPANIMVRTLEPLDLVLADFGLARRLDLSKEMHSRLIVSAAYASPQTASGAISPAMDFWSLGIILAELAQGRNPFQLPNGEWLPDQVIMDWISSRPIDLSGIEDERLRNLCAGLTTRDDRKGRRWGAQEVRAWLAGEDPEVAPEPQGATTTSPRSASPFPFTDPQTGRTRPFTDPRELSRALALDWEAALALLSGTASHRAEQRALRNFLRSLSLSEAEQILAEQDDAEERLIRLLIELDPETRPTFRGYSVDEDGLLSLAREESESARSALAALYAERILLDCSRAQGQARLAELDAAWHEEVSRFEQTVDSARSEQDQPLLADQREREAALATARSQILAALLDEELRQQTLARGVEAGVDESARRAGWFTALAGLKGQEDSPGRAVALALLRPLAVRLADQREREEGEERRRREFEEALAAVPSLRRPSPPAKPRRSQPQPQQFKDVGRLLERMKERTSDAYGWGFWICAASAFVGAVAGGAGGLGAGLLAGVGVSLVVWVGLADREETARRAHEAEAAARCEEEWRDYEETIKAADARDAERAAIKARYERGEL